ncbi:MAG: hypothetical protein Q4B70_18590 [Lachnospiraceae bacterium]|nr:hypothetical protein [Lachnospiraceae bacterium]
MNYIEIVISICSGIIAGLISGYMVSKFFKIKEKKESERNKRALIANKWINDFYQLIAEIEEAVAINIYETYDFWSISDTDFELSERLINVKRKLTTRPPKSKIPEELSDEIFAVLEDLHNWAINPKKNKGTRKMNKLNSFN